MHNIAGLKRHAQAIGLVCLHDGTSLRRQGECQRSRRRQQLLDQSLALVRGEVLQAVAGGVARRQILCQR